jgi:hypothetical protein
MSSKYITVCSGLIVAPVFRIRVQETGFNNRHDFCQLFQKNALILYLK